MRVTPENYESWERRLSPQNSSHHRGSQPFLGRQAAPLGIPEWVSRQRRHGRRQRQQQQPQQYRRRLPHVHTHTHTHTHTSSLLLSTLVATMILPRLVSSAVMSWSSVAAVVALLLVSKGLSGVQAQGQVWQDSFRLDYTYQRDAPTG